LPRRVERHLPHLAHALLGGAGDHQRLVDPRLELADQRHRAAGDDPVLGAVALTSLDIGNLGLREAANARAQ
jgi:hypothetical protein